MSDAPLAPPPSAGWPWLKIALVASLALNLLVIGAATARFLVHEPPGRISGISEMQLIPRKFFGDVDRARRGELLAVFKGYRKEFSEGREDRRKLAADLAAALAAEPYDEAKVRQAIDAFSQRSASLITRGGEAAYEFISMLTAGERKMLATRILERSGGHHGRMHGD